MAFKKTLKEAEPPIHIDCAHTHCQKPALVRVKTDTGFANFCQYHYSEYWGRELQKPKKEPKLNAHCQAIRDAYLRKGEVKPMSEYVESVEV